MSKYDLYLVANTVKNKLQSAKTNLQIHKRLTENANKADIFSLFANITMNSMMWMMASWDMMPNRGNVYVELFNIIESDKSTEDKISRAEEVLRDKTTIFLDRVLDREPASEECIDRIHEFLEMLCNKICCQAIEETIATATKALPKDVLRKLERLVSYEIGDGEMYLKRIEQELGRRLTQSEIARLRPVITEAIDSEPQTI
jgi:hypothetical protein